MIIRVYLARQQVRDRVGGRLAFPQERLVPLGPDDRVIAVIEAPPGSRVRHRPDQHGPDQLLVPLRPDHYFWRWFGRRRVIPVKYLIHEARQGAHALKLLEYSARHGTAAGPGPAIGSDFNDSFRENP